MGILGNTHIGALNKRKIKEKINGKVLLSFFGGCKHKTFVLLHPTKTSWRQGNRKGLKLHSNTHDIEGLFVKVNLRKTKWLLFYNLSLNNSFWNTSAFFKCLSDFDKLVATILKNVSEKEHL